FLFSSRRRHTRFSRDWSSDVCSSDLPRWFWIFLGIAELAAAVGITLPGLTRILPWLVVWAAAGIAFVMVAATIWHVVRGEFSSRSEERRVGEERGRRATLRQIAKEPY